LAVARSKQSVIQRDMSLGEARKDFLERDDLDVRSISLKTASNVRATATGAIDARPGLQYVRPAESDHYQMVEINPADGEIYGLLVDDSGLTVLNEDGTVKQTITSVDWSASDDLYVLPLGEETLIGAESLGIKVLAYDGSTFSVNDFSFLEGVGGTIAQPYWVFEDGITIQPSALTGTITITASPSGWWPSPSTILDGTRIRYLGQEIEITGITNATTLAGTVVDSLPPTFNVTVSDGSEYRVGQVVVGQDTNYQGIITAIATNVLTCATLSFFDGPDVGERLSSSTTAGVSFASAVTAVATTTPAATKVWDEPMLSDIRGWPRGASAGAGRLVFTNFPLIPNGIAVSSSRFKNDFQVGAADDDAIARTIGDDNPRILHVVDAGDLVFLSDKGCYVQSLRESAPLSPSTFNPVLFDRRGANSVKPALVNDGIVFVENNGSTVSAAVLDGNVYLKWSITPLSTFHNHLFKSPVKICGPSLRSPKAEKEVTVINGDGTLAIISYAQSIAEPGAGIFPWFTDGSFVDAAPLFDELWAVVSREIDGINLKYIEKFDEETYVDCAVFPDGGSPDPAITFPLRTKSVRYLDGTGVHAALTVNDDGTVTNEPAYVAGQQIGLNFLATVSPWPVEVVQSARAGTFDCRCIRFLLSMQSTGPFQVKCNSHTRVVGGYEFGDDLSVAPALRTKKYAVPVFGRRQQAELSVIKHEPGPFRVLYTGQEVQY
jgi:hypothetical protein